MVRKGIKYDKSKDCIYKRCTIILRCREERYNERSSSDYKGKSFRNILIEEIQVYGRRYPFPKGAYGSMFSIWLREDNPKPFGGECDTIDAIAGFIAWMYYKNNPQTRFNFVLEREDEDMLRIKEKNSLSV